MTYEVAGMPEKNKDTLFKDLLETIKFAENKFLSETLFPEQVDRDDKKAPTTFGYKIKVCLASPPWTAPFTSLPTVCPTNLVSSERTYRHPHEGNSSLCAVH